MSEYAEELFRRFSPDQLKADARAKLKAKVSDTQDRLKATATAKVSDVQERVRTQGLIAKDHLQHDRRTQLATGAAALVGIGALATRLARRRSSEVSSFRVQGAYAPSSVDVDYTYARRDFMGPPPPVYRAGVITHDRAYRRDSGFALERKRSFGFGKLLLSAISLAGLRALSKRPEAQDLKQRALDKAQALSIDSSERFHSLADQARSKFESRFGKSSGSSERMSGDAEVIALPAAPLERYPGR